MEYGKKSVRQTHLSKVCIRLVGLNVYSPRFISWPSSAGTVPTILLNPRYNLLRFFNEPSSLGIGPVKSFLATNQAKEDEKCVLHTSTARLYMHLPKPRVSKDPRKPTSVGILPVRSHSSVWVKAAQTACEGRRVLLCI